MFRKQSDARGRQTALIEEMIGNQKIVQAFGYEDKSSARFAEINQELKECSQKAIFYSSLTNPSTRFVNNVIYAGVALAGAFMIPGGTLTVGGLSVLLSYANQYMKPFNDISSVITELQNALACAARIFALLEETPESPDPEETISNVQGEVNIDNVSFRYVPDKKLIENFHLHAEPGKRIAIVGPTGCGKTTFINLLMRFYDVTDGRILVDGHNVKDFERGELRQMFGMVLQDTWLFGGTVKDNIKYGKEDATDDEVIEAAKAAHVHHYIKTLPNGYNSEINEESSNISAGQKQLLTIARVILTDPKILILDEATSSIDTRTEIQIQKAMDNLMKGRTSFIIAHRLSTIKNADLILVMDHGDIVEQGTHEELLAKGGFYEKLYNSQFEEEEE